MSHSRRETFSENRGWTAAGVSSVAVLGLLVSGCAQTPLGPTVQVMPGPGKSFDAVHLRPGRLQAVRRQPGRRSGAECQQPRRRRGRHRHGTRRRAGAAIGGGRGAAIGAGSGAIAGTGLGMGSSSNEQYGHPAAIRQRLRPVHVLQGQHGAWLRPDDGQFTASARRRLAGPDDLTAAVQQQLIRLGYHARSGRRCRRPADRRRQSASSRPIPACRVDGHAVTAAAGALQARRNQVGGRELSSSCRLNHPAPLAFPPESAYLDNA